MFLDVNRREIQLGDKLADLSGEWYADDETPVVESEGDELCIYVEDTTIYLSENRNREMLFNSGLIWKYKK